MVTLPALSSGWACVLDNNYTGANDLVWMTEEEFIQRWRGGQQGWCVVLLTPPTEVK